MDALHILSIFSVGFLGACLGSFAYVLATRLGTGQSFFSGRSHCASCARTLAARDLVPLFSFLFLRGRCRTCGSRLSSAYIVTEITAALLFLAMLFAFGVSIALIPALVAATLLTALLAYDVRHTILPDVLVYPFIALACIVALLAYGTGALFFTTCIAALALSGILFALWFFSKGRAIGLGDAKITFGLALLAGYPASVSGFMLSFWIGAIVMLSLILLLPGKLSRKSEIPFAPFLVLGFLLPLVSGWTLPLGI